MAKSPLNPRSTPPLIPPPGEGYSAWVDGSYQDGRVGYGAVILNEDTVVAELYGPVKPEDSGSARNVAGELIAVGHVLRWCQQHGVQRVIIFHDYEGISAWANGSWKTKNDLTRRYQQFVRGCGILVTFVKVKSHSSTPLNDRADELARKGAAMAPINPEVLEQEAELQQVLERFARNLEALGVTATYDGFHNRQFARLKLGSGGRMDLYHSAKNPWNAHFVGVKDPRIQRMWEAFRTDLAV